MRSSRSRGEEGRGGEGEGEENSPTPSPPEGGGGERERRGEERRGEERSLQSLSRALKHAPTLKLFALETDTTEVFEVFKLTETLESEQ